MQVYLSVCPSFMESRIVINAKAKANLLVSGVAPGECFVPRWRSLGGRPRPPVVAFSAALNGQQDHYTLLGVPATATSADIKKAYRLLARKYHPDVSKDSQASEVFKSVRHAYDVLSNEATRAQYDGALKFQEVTGGQWHKSWTDDPNVEEVKRVHRWAEVRQQIWRERYRQQFDASENSSEHGETDNEYGEEISDNERGPFSEVLKSAFFTLFYMQMLGCRISLTLCGLSALLDKKLDAGYKVGYLIAWILGGRGGILLTLCLSFASWLCGKTSSSLMAVVVVAMWIGANLGRYAPLPQGALITLLYMSLKLQVDLS
ncbi:hypothetical protein NE237_010533 [Protea cynaroides]|uniref:J domain-containing protein n=1 Tax=Protea cynaroides TaxID=273540 RepID=A0A9Q0R1C3_9MAGN|nr:hypothetical protein NE237_010533 [Protea cynaroides]